MDGPALMENPLHGLSSWVADIVESFGYVGVAVLTLLENLIPPIPSEIILPLAGFLVGQGRFSFLPVVLAATLGSVGGALILYGLGAWLGERRLYMLMGKFGRYVLMDESDLDKARDWFERHGAKAILVGRLVPGIRSIISIPAGLVKMPIWQFITYTLIGSTVWNVTLISFGWALGDQWDKVQDYVKLMEYVVILVIVAAGLWFLWARRHKVRRRA